jgi:hypothetical protein
MIYPYMQKMDHIKSSAMHDVQSAISCMIRSNLLNLTYKSIYKFYFQAFLFIKILTKH